jgi:hypothetical protein
MFSLESDAGLEALIVLGVSLVIVVLAVLELLLLLLALLEADSIAIDC